MTHVQQLDGLVEATQRLVRTVDSLSDDDLAAPSVLPGWSRAHVVAHLTLNAEGLAGVLAGVVEGEDVPMYRSQEDRDADIEELAAGAPRRAAGALPGQHHRVPGGGVRRARGRLGGRLPPAGRRRR